MTLRIDTLLHQLSILTIGCFLLGWTSFAYAQGPGGTGTVGPPNGTISGSITDSQSDEAVGTATVAVWQAQDSTLVTGTVSNAAGIFVIDQLRAGRYYVEVSFVGYIKHTTPELTLTPNEPRVDLGVISLSPDLAQLEGVEVTAERADVSFEVDRTVYNTKNQLASTGCSATDVLQNIPSVEVDVDGKVSLRGSQNIAILINGKPSPVRGDFLATFLQQIPANSVERVEVIPNPSAKFDPDGMAGILNIVLKQDAEFGTSGGLTLGFGTNERYNASGNINLQKDKLTLFANYGFRYEDRNSEGYNFRENRFLDPLTFVEQDNVGLRNRVSHLLNTSADYALNDKNVLSASALLSRRIGEDEDLNAYTQFGSTRDLTGRFDRLSESSSSGLNMDYKLAYNRTVEPSRNELSTELRYNRSRGDSFDALSQRLLTLQGVPTNDAPGLQTNDLNTQDSEWTLQTDYIRPLGKAKLETGFKGILRQIDNDFYSETFAYSKNTFVPDVDLINEFVYDERVYAGYGILSNSLGNFEMQAGLRAEQAFTTFDLDTTGEAFDNNYFSFFPSAFLAYNLTETQQIKASYSKRIQRPRTRQLNPFTSFTDPLNLRVGNPQLQPEYIHAFEVALQHFSKLGSLSLTPYFRRTIDKMQRFKAVDNNTGISTLTFRNFDRSDSYGAEVIASMRLGRKLSGFASFNAYKLVTDGSNVDSDLANDAFSWSTRMSATWKVRKGLDMQLFYFYRAPIDVAQGRISSFSVANLSLRQKLLDDKASLSLRFSDPLDQMGFTFEVDDDTFYQLGSRKWESRAVYLTFTYNFGKPPRRSNRDIGDRDGGGMNDVGLN